MVRARSFVALLAAVLVLGCPPRTASNDDDVVDDDDDDSGPVSDDDDSAPTEPECGNGIREPGELCDGDCPTECDDAIACTENILYGSAENCDAYCEYPPVTACGPADGCCPAGCTTFEDLDCTALCAEPSDWTFEDVYTAAGVVNTDNLSDLTLDADGLPHFLVSENGGVSHVWMEPGGTWATDVVTATGYFRGNALIQGPDGTWYASFADYDWDLPQIAAVLPPGGEWTLETIDEQTDRRPGLRRSFFLDADGAVHLIYWMFIGSTPGTVVQTTFHHAVRGEDGTWTSNNIADGNSTGFRNDVEIAPDGSWVLAFDFNYYLRMTVKVGVSTDGESWATDTVEDPPPPYRPGYAGHYIDLDVLSTGEMVISYSNQWSGGSSDPNRANGVWLARGTPGSWTKEAIDNTLVRVNSAVVVDADDTVHVAYPKDEGLWIADETVDGWVHRELPQAGTVNPTGKFSSLVDDDGVRFLLVHPPESSTVRLGISCP